MKTVFDLETDNLLEDVTQVWCCGITLPTEKGITSCVQSPDTFLDLLDDATTLIGHNIIGFDLPVLKKLYDWSPRPDVMLVDTLLLSKMLCRHRHHHSLGSWGETFNFPKGDHSDWTQYSEEMKTYCIQDVAVTTKLYHYLLRKMEKL